MNNLKRIKKLDRKSYYAFLINNNYKKFKGTELLLEMIDRVEEIGYEDKKEIFFFRLLAHIPILRIFYPKNYLSFMLSSIYVREYNLLMSKIQNLDSYIERTRNVIYVDFQKKENKEEA